jgi:cation diffusion facilitator family transporter
MMKLFTHWIVRKLISNNRDIDNVIVRARYGTLEAVASIVINLLLFVVKLILGLMVNSVSLIADAVHTLSDSGTSIIILIGFRIAKKPGDREHPFGHGRAEPIAALIVAIILIVAGVELLRSSAVRIMHPKIEAAQISWFLAVILVVAVIIKELMARFSRELGRMIQSKTLEADFWHHRSDAFSTLLVLVAMACAHLNFMYVDGVAGVGVALVVMYSGYAVAHSVISPLLGERPSLEMLNQIEDIARSPEGVLGVHDIIVHRYGRAKFISLHIEVDNRRPAIELHNLSEQVEELIENKLGGSVVVHIDPL